MPSVQDALHGGPERPVFVSQEGVERCFGFGTRDLAEGVDGLTGEGSSVVVFQVGGDMVDGMDESRHRSGVPRNPSAWAHTESSPAGTRDLASAAGQLILKSKASILVELDRHPIARLPSEQEVGR